MRIFAGIYLIGAILFFFRPEETFYLINVGPRVFKIAEEIPIPSERFWVVLSTAMMMMLFFAATYSSLYPGAKGMVGIHVLSKLTSVSGFLFVYLEKRYFAYVLGAGVDGLIALIVLVFFLRSAASGGAVAAPPPRARDEGDNDHDHEPSQGGGSSGSDTA